MTAILTVSGIGRCSVNELARREGLHPATIWRWLLHGVRGHKLRSVRVGGRRFVLDDDWQAFCAALNADLSDATTDAQFLNRQGANYA